MAVEEHLGIEKEKDRSRLTCDWCGKEGVSIWWSGSQSGNYCSMRCSAAAGYRRNILITICIIAYQSIFELYMILLALKYHDFSGFFVPMFFVLNVVITLLTLSFVYMVYVGRVMRKERERSEKQEQDVNEWWARRDESQIEYF